MHPRLTGIAAKDAVAFKATQKLPKIISMN